MKFLDISIASPNDSLGFFPNHNSYGVVSTDLDGALFKVNVAVSIAYPQNDSGRSVRDIIDLPLSFWGYAIETATFTK